MKQFCRFVVRHMAVFVVLAGLCGAFVPASMQWVVPRVPWLLGLVMFGMGMTIRTEDLREIAKHPYEVFIGALCQYTIMPLIAWVLVMTFDLPPALAAGVVLVGTCPGGTASNVVTYIAKGDVALSVAMTTATTLLAPLVTPFLTWQLVGAWIDVSLPAMMLSIAEMVLLPVFLGCLVRHFFYETVMRLMDWLPFVSVVTVVLLVGGVVSMSASSLFEMGAVIALVVILHNGFGLLLGYAAAKAFRLPEAKTRAVAIEVGMQNSGLAASLAILYFGPAAAIPGAIFSVWHNISGALFANYFVSRDERRASQVAGKAAGEHL